MESGIPLRPWTRLSVLGTLLLILTVLLYTTTHSPENYSEGSTVLPLLPDGEMPQQLNTTFDNLELLLNRPISNVDFAAKGDRAAALADFIAANGDDNIANHPRFRALIRKEFPWWTSGNLETLFQGTEGQTGIVVCVNSANALLAAHLIRTLRNVLDSILPIQIAFAGDDDLSKKDQKVLLNLRSDLELVNLLDHFDESVAWLREGKYAMKPFAVIASRFRKTILVDADVIFLQKPEAELDVHGGFRTTGTLFYHDRAYKMQGKSRTAWVRSLLRGKNPSKYLETSLFWKEDLWQEMESGVVVFDKGHPRIPVALLFTAWMNTKDVRERETYSHVLGDKETYWLACELSNTPYYFQPDYAGVIGILEPGPNNSPPSTICSAHILHMHHAGDAPFWFNGGLLLNKALGGNDLATLTHYIDGGVFWSDQPMWRYDGNEYWCAEGKPASALKDTKLDNIVDQIMREARVIEMTLSS